jgi:hypothetical protein
MIKEISLNYNYIFFNSFDGGLWKNDLDGYFSICAEDLNEISNVKVVPHPLDYAPLFERFLFGIHNSGRLNHFLKMPFREKWYPKYFKHSFSNSKPICFVFLIYPPLEYIKYLRSVFLDCKIVKVTRDLIHTQLNAFEPYYKAKCFDSWLTFDEEEAKKYGLVSFSEFESITKIPVCSTYPIFDVFFAGRAKNRLPILLDVYDKFSETGLNCYYYILGVKKEDRIYRPSIKYTEKPLSYREMLKLSVNSRCLLEVNQIGAVGYTSRFLEAVMYNKRLITNNLSIRDSGFYNPEFIQLFSNASEIDPSFILRDEKEVNYHYNGEFSPIHLIRRIDNELSK